jgi:hypothetical protein
MKLRGCARRVGVCLILGCACVTQSRLGHAEWEAIPDISLEAEMNDNPALNAVGTTETRLIEDASRLLADAVIRIRNVEPRGELTFEPRVRRDAYVQDEYSRLESTDVFLRSNGVHRGQTVRLGYSADVAQERILGVEFLETLPEEPVLDDPSAAATTQIGINERRTRVGIAPYLEVALNSRSAIVLDGRLVDVDYESGMAAGRTDFLDRGIGGEYRRDLGDQRGSLGVRVFVTGYEAAINANTTDTRGVEVGYARDMSELWSWNVAIGTQRADYALTTGGRRVRGTTDTPIFGAGIAKRGERSSMRADLERVMSPDALGFVAPRDELRWSWQRQMSPRVTGRMVVRVIDAEGVPSVIGSDRQYGRLQLALDWQLRPTWSLITAYAYARASSEVSFGDAAESNALTLGVRYRGRSQRPGAFAQ